MRHRTATRITDRLRRAVSRLYGARWPGPPTTLGRWVGATRKCPKKALYGSGDLGGC